MACFAPHADAVADFSTSRRVVACGCRARPVRVHSRNEATVLAYERYLFNAALAQLRAFNLSNAETYLKELQQRQPEDDEIRRILEFVDTYKTRPVDMQLEIFVGSLSER